MESFLGLVSDFDESSFLDLVADFGVAVACDKRFLLCSPLPAILDFVMSSIFATNRVGGARV